jgi:transcription initiation factor TFIID subunit TAF12
MVRGQRPGARQLPDSLRAGIGMAGVPVDGPNRTVRMRRVPRYQQLQQQQQQKQQNQQQQQPQQGPPGEDAGGFSVIDWDALDWEADVQLREEETQRAKEVRREAHRQLEATLLCT